MEQLLRKMHDRPRLTDAEQETLYDKAFEEGRAWHAREPVEMAKTFVAAARNFARLHRSVDNPRARQRLMNAIRAIALRVARPRQRRSTRTVVRTTRLPGRKRKRRRRSSGGSDEPPGLAACAARRADGRLRGLHRPAP
jgi:hypothetical protein